MNRMLIALAMLITTSTFAQIPPPEVMRGNINEAKLKPAKTQIETEDLSKKYASTITAAELKGILTVVASDEMEGRETASEGQRKAEAYIVKQIQSFGIRPIDEKGVTDGYLQKIPFTKEEWGKVELTANDEEFKHLRDFYCFRSMNNDMPLTSVGEIIFLGYGIDDEVYSDYEGIDVKGKVIMILADEPLDNNGNSWITGSEKPSTWSSNWKRKKNGK
jgi:hypothetical protein